MTQTKQQSFDSESRILQRLRSFLFENADNADLVTFDVFDNLISRTVYPPDSIKIASTDHLRKKLQVLSIVKNIDQLMDERTSFEQELRKQNQSEGNDSECRLYDVFFRWVQTYFPPDQIEAIVIELMEVEIEMECAVSTSPVGWQNLMLQMRPLFKKWIYVSDMYLPRWAIDKLLSKHNLLLFFDKGYVSSEENINKSSGRLFRRILEEEGVEPTRWIHVADRLRYDLFPAEREGAKIFWTSSLCESRTKSSIESLFRISNRTKYWDVWRFHDWCAAHYASTGPSNLAKDIGFYAIGPLLVYFILQVHKRIKEEGIKVVYFPAREGFLLETLFDLLRDISRCDEKVIASYCYLNRATTFPASAYPLSEWHRKMAFDTSYPCLDSCFRHLGMDSSVTPVVPQDFGIASLQTSLPQRHLDPRVQEIFRTEAFQDALRRAVRSERNLLLDYLRSIDFFNHDVVALVDIGWRGTVQHALNSALSDLESPFIQGFYMGFTGLDVPELTSPESIEGVCFDARLGCSGNFAVGRFLELFEMVCQGYHPTILSLCKESNVNVVTPHFRDVSSGIWHRERANYKVIAQLQTGILEYAQIFISLFRLRHFEDSEHLQYALDQVNRLLRYPSPGEASLLGYFFHAEDFRKDTVGFDGDAIGAFRQSVAVVRKGKRGGIWLEGLARNSGGSLLLFAVNSYRALKARGGF
ncbi:MAG: hypothetical protein KDD42_03235 [Bdellovibrionales bacterium]|nr:hypothetical protein [Bdellovibrionales bacterium]